MFCLYPLVPRVDPSAEPVIRRRRDEPGLPDRPLLLADPDEALPGAPYVFWLVLSVPEQACQQLAQEANADAAVATHLECGHGNLDVSVDLDRLAREVLCVRQLGFEQIAEETHGALKRRRIQRLPEQGWPYEQLWVRQLRAYLIQFSQSHWMGLPRWPTSTTGLTLITKR
jgi:hypothetical protein